MHAHMYAQQLLFPDLSYFVNMPTPKDKQNDR
jgi:hypothetical protein